MSIFNKKDKKADNKTLIKSDVLVDKNKEVKNNIEKQDDKHLYRKNAYIKTLIKQPVMSERALNLISNDNVYTFLVSKKATKPEIKKQIANIYKVDVEKVRVLNIKNKTKLFRGVKSHPGKTKKAFVSVKKGQKIEIAGNI